MGLSGSEEGMVTVSPMTASKFEEPDSPAMKTEYSQDFSLVVPAFNEERRISQFLMTLKDIETEFREIIVVCDGDDKTADIVRITCPQYNVLEFPSRLGKGGAILEGFKAATGGVVGYVDADGAFDSKDILKVFRAVDNNIPVVQGSRWLKDSIIESKQPLIRIFLGRMYHYVSFAVLGMLQKDTQCGLKALRKGVVDELKTRVKVRNFSFDTALIYHCKLMGLKVLELPVKWRDVDGSKVKPFSSAFFMFMTVIALRLIHSEKTSKFKKVFMEREDFFDLT